ncbi:MAG: cob(I)yrinic acid a,c-diamide adenosyltransferase [Firmicutes bacterium]|nr:cob(I)yrinic acid a,c-diamide adenosyltransferase [Bacillota bacterium]
MRRLGMVQVYTGNGKGKTTAALGLALRAVGHGWRVVVFQFLKGERTTGELAAARRLAPDLVIIPCGTGEFIIDRPPTATEVALAREGLARARRVLEGGEVEMVVLDEVAAAVNLGLLEEEAVLAAINSRAPEVEVVLTGRSMPAGLLAVADLISEIGNLRHPFQRGLAAREGIDY